MFYIIFKKNDFFIYFYLKGITQSLRLDLHQIENSTVIYDRVSNPVRQDTLMCLEKYPGANKLTEEEFMNNFYISKIFIFKKLEYQAHGFN